MGAALVHQGTPAPHGAPFSSRQRPVRPVPSPPRHRLPLQWPHPPMQCSTANSSKTELAAAATGAPAPNDPMSHACPWGPGQTRMRTKKNVSRRFDCGHRFCHKFSALSLPCTVTFVDKEEGQPNTGFCCAKKRFRPRICLGVLLARRRVSPPPPPPTVRSPPRVRHPPPPPFQCLSGPGGVPVPPTLSDEGGRLSVHGGCPGQAHGTAPPPPAAVEGACRGMPNGPIPMSQSDMYVYICARVRIYVYTSYTRMRIVRRHCAYM